MNGLLACVGKRRTCFFSLTDERVQRKAIQGNPQESSSLTDIGAPRVRPMQPDSVINHFVTYGRKCNCCDNPLGKDTENLKVAKIGGSYFCFCSDDCWYQWLNKVSTTQESKSTKSIPSTASQLQPSLLPCKTLELSPQSTVMSKTRTRSSSAPLHIRLSAPGKRITPRANIL